MLRLYAKYLLDVKNNKEESYFVSSKYIIIILKQ